MRDYLHSAPILDLFMKNSTFTNKSKIVAFLKYFYCFVKMSTLIFYGKQTATDNLLIKKTQKSSAELATCCDLHKTDFCLRIKIYTKNDKITIYYYPKGQTFLWKKQYEIDKSGFVKSRFEKPSDEQII